MTVLQLNEKVRSILGSSPEVRDVWVAGEISNLTKHSSGHYYFTLKDSGSEIRCSLFKGARARVNFEPNENMKVIAFGRVDIYVQRGSYQFIVDTMRSSGLGDLYLAYDELKRKLEAEGLFEPSRKRKIPRYPGRIGVVTSPTGAAIHDILNISGRRFPADILLYPALVQGDGAPASIIKGIRLLNDEDVDVIIVGRGGGSIEDLWAFNDEGVARAIAASRVPIISAVGHETDFTIADLVADLRAPTPSAAAEIALADRSEEMRHIDVFSMRLTRSLNSIIESMTNRFRILDAKLSPKRAGDAVEMLNSELSGLTVRADSSLLRAMNTVSGKFRILDARLSPRRAKESVDQFTMRLDDLSDSVDVSVLRILSDRRKEVGTLTMRLDGLSPTSVLGRGYTLITDGRGRTVTSVSGMAVGSDVEIRMRDGYAKAEVKEVKANERK